MEHQKHLFSLHDNIHFLNGAYMTPNLKISEESGIEGIKQLNNPYLIKPNDFFEPVDNLKKSFSKLIDCDNYQRIAIIPSVSYGIANVVKNIKVKQGDEILIISEQFPSNYYSWSRLSKDSDAILKIIKPSSSINKAEEWNKKILESINDNTVVVSMGIIHWTDGTLFDIKAIREKTKQHNALLIIDGTQGIGVLPFSITDIQPDALICAGYKWLLGPYSLSIAYYGEYFDDGIPIEESVFNRVDSHKFSQLVNYQEQYKPYAYRYCVGETCNFALIPMLDSAINQILSWTTESIREYCISISSSYIQELRNMGCIIEDDKYRACHLFGIKVPNHIDMNNLKETLEENKIIVAIRGEYIRVSLYVYNTTDDLKALVTIIRSVIELTE